MLLLILKTILSLLALLFSLFMGAGYYFSNQIIRPKVIDYERTLSIEIEKGRIGGAYFNQLLKEEVYISSPFGYKLHGFFLKSEENKKVIILNHGITHSLMGSLKFVEMYKRMGFSILLHDLRYHGKSGGASVTFGYREKEDLKAWIDWMLSEYKEIEVVGTHGESMGSSIGIEHAAMDSRIRFIISDCGFSSWREILEYRMKWDFKVPVFPIIYFAELWTWIRTGAKFQSVLPEKSVQFMDIPIFFIHGLSDKYTPHAMTEKMFRLKKGSKQLWLVPNARHTDSYNTQKEQYERHIKDFLKDIGVN